jgi:hypothetical protein
LRHSWAKSFTLLRLPTLSVADGQLDVARRFLRLANFDNGVFERLGRYEAALWRQVRQTIFTLEGLRSPALRVAVGVRRIVGNTSRSLIAEGKRSTRKCFGDCLTDSGSDVRAFWPRGPKSNKGSVV